MGALIRILVPGGEFSISICCSLKEPDGLNPGRGCAWIHNVTTKRLISKERGLFTTDFSD